MSTNPAQLEIEILLNRSLSQTRAWLAPPPMPSVRLRRSSELLIRQLKEALGRTNPREIRWFIDRLTDLSENIRKSKSLEYREPSFIMIECALAAYQMQNYAEAVKFLECAMEVCEGGDTEHFEAVIRSVLGCMHWRSSGQKDHAIVCWEQSIGIYEDLRLRHSGMQLSGWYKDRIDDINSILELALELFEIPSSSTFDAENLGTRDPDHINAEFGYWGILPIYEHIRAGDFGSSAILVESVGDLEIDRVFINGNPHRIVNINGGHVTKLLPMNRSVVIKVSGDSMNRANIADGDHVLLQLLPKDISDFDLIMHPEDYSFDLDAGNSQVVKDGDIVAAETIDEDNKITLKRIFRRGEKIVLEPDSTNPVHTPREFDKKRPGFFVCGVVVAIFKPI